MTHLIKLENGNGLELKLEGEFTEDELLVARSILTIKAIHGVSARFGNGNGVLRRAVESNEEGFRSLMDGRGILDVAAQAMTRMIKEYAEKIGIPDKRYEEIVMQVYKAESNM